MPSINDSIIDLSKYEEIRPPRSNNEAWNEVRIYHKVPKEGEYPEIWVCKYCDEIHTGNVGRVEAHLACIKVKGAASCLKVPSEVKERMALAVKRKDADTRENKRRKHESGIRNSLSCALQSRSSGPNPIGEGNPSHSTLLEVTNGSGEVSQGSAGWTSVNPQGFTGLVPDVVGRTRTSRLGNSQLSAVGEGGNVSNTARLEQPSSEINTVDFPMSLWSCGLPIFKEIESAGSGATGGQDADAAKLFQNSNLDDDFFQFDDLYSGIGLGSTPLTPNGEAGSNHSNFTGQQFFPNRVNMETGMPPQRSNLGEICGSGLTGPEDVRAGGFGTACLEDVGARGSNSTSPRLQGQKEPLHNTVRQIRTSGLGNSLLNVVGGGGNISSTARLEQPSGEINTVDFPMSLWSRRLPIFKEIESAGSGATGGQGADADSTIGSRSSPLNPYGEAGSNNCSSLAHQPPPPSADSMAVPSMGVSSQYSNLYKIQGSGMAGPEDGGAEFSNSTSLGHVFLESGDRLDFNESANSSNPACQPQIPGIAMAAPNSLINIANGPVGPRGPEAGRLERNIHVISGTSGMSEAASVWALPTNLTDIPRMSKAAFSWRLPAHLTDIKARLDYDLNAYIRSSWEFVILQNSVSTLKACWKNIGCLSTTRMEEMDGWLKSAASVRQTAVDLLVNIGFNPQQVRQLWKIFLSTEQVRQLSDDLFKKLTFEEIVQLLKNMEQVGEQIKKLKKESEDFFIQSPLKMMLIELMNCRWDSSLKDTSIIGEYIRPDDGREENRNIERIHRSTERVELGIMLDRFVGRVRKFSITERSIRTQKTYLEKIGGFATTRMMKIDGWLKNVEPVRDRAVDLLVNIGLTPEQASQLSKIDVSAEQVRRLSDDLLKKRPLREIVQLQKNMEELGKQIIKLKKESEDFFNQISLKTVLIKFMNCRWDSSLKDPLKETLPMPLA